MGGYIRKAARRVLRKNRARKAILSALNGSLFTDISQEA